MTEKTEKNIDSYYSNIDKQYINNLCKDNNLKNLINLSTINDLYVFNKKNKKITLKSKDKLLKECNNIKKKELKQSSVVLSNLAKLSGTHDLYLVKNMCDDLQYKITNLNNLIDCIHNIEASQTQQIIPIKMIDINKENNIVNFDNSSNNNLKIIDIKHNLDNYSLSNDSENFIECYANC